MSSKYYTDNCLECTGCTKRFENLTGLKRHYAAIHGPNKRRDYKCPCCDYSGRFAFSQIKRHMIMAHEVNVDSPDEFDSIEKMCHFEPLSSLKEETPIKSISQEFPNIIVYDEESKKWLEFPTYVPTSDAHFAAESPVSMSYFAECPIPQNFFEEFPETFTWDLYLSEPCDPSRQAGGPLFD